MTDAVITLEMDPRFLYVRVHEPPLLLDVINCHGPHKKHGKVAVKKYDETISKNSLPAYDLVISADVNGRLGSVNSADVDDHQPDASITSIPDEPSVLCLCSEYDSCVCYLCFGYVVTWQFIKSLSRIVLVCRSGSGSFARGARA